MSVGAKGAQKVDCRINDSVRHALSWKRELINIQIGEMGGTRIVSMRGVGPLLVGHLIKIDWVRKTNDIIKDTTFYTRNNPGGITNTLRFGGRCQTGSYWEWAGGAISVTIWPPGWRLFWQVIIKSLTHTHNEIFFHQLSFIIWLISF